MDNKVSQSNLAKVTQQADPSKILTFLMLELNGFLGQKEVERLSSLSGSEIYRRQRAGTFPFKVPIGNGQRKGYRAREIKTWLDNPTGWAETGAAERT